MIGTLLAEDDNGRVRRIKEWLQADVRLVHAGGDTSIGTRHIEEGEIISALSK